MESERRRPRIGITADPTYPVDEYVRAVAAAGGEPVVLMPDSGRAPADLRDLDGIVFSGGEDVAPAHYGAAPHPRTHAASDARDAYELALVRAAFAARLPTLGICRGMQVSNVAFGGSLYQHVPDVFGERVPHRLMIDGKAERGLIGEHRVAVESGSLLSTIAGPEIVTGSRHHQAVDRVAPGLRVVALAPDGVVEALESADPDRFWLAVQWHPESTTSLDGGASAALFAALVQAAGA